MLGEQLIKNERIALVELVKNAYDADATQVQVDFRGFDEDFGTQPGATIVIVDNGTGMSEEVVRTAWMNPATPTKAAAKKKDEPRTPRGRVLQGEKGIGRFATFKLGSRVALVSRAEGDGEETTLLVDISELNEGEPGRASNPDFYLEDVAALVDTADPVFFRDAGAFPGDHGARLEISGLRAPWSRRLVREAFDDLDRLQPLMWSPTSDPNLRAEFGVTFLRDGVEMGLGAERNEEFQAVLDRAVLRVTGGCFDEESRSLRFDLNGRPVELSIDSGEVRGLRLFRKWFLQDPKERPEPTCGSFGFEFFIFDFSASAPAQHSLDSDEKKLLEDHRVYLYRDGIRVYPYGDPGDDWLHVDAIRGTQSARSMFSSDQLVGFVTISQEANPRLRDKTSREGLLETGRATGDFVALLQTVLSYLRSKPYAQYAAANHRARERALGLTRIDTHVEALRRSEELTDKALAILAELERAVQAERELAGLRVARTEQLAGVGLSVETASHDLIAAGTEALRLARHLVADLRLLDLAKEPVFAVAKLLVTQLEYISARFKDVQGLFVSTRQKETRLDVLQILRRVRALYSQLHKDEEVEFEIDDSVQLFAVTTEGAVLQCLINLVDNATYWLMTAPQERRIIRAFAIDQVSLVVTDNGPGVKPQDEPFIFEAFYSGKGEAGKGLGLYIARQNGLRSGFDIQLERTEDPRELPGATFVVRFKKIAGGQ